eukprot:CAMPEP_0174843984 /NCGR_PEP_ID=MMETSP1114-20130205/10845_1 /TAXON_ID=312471 /ORGANISM="Neobodo designis, Strain CCAP 1951/1" /LENGTH=1111 /DNA_ID=CAMNT_0016078217 /DNA_START=30 /DNA_END=3365 /DNA_ORIENTATION=+
MVRIRQDADLSKRDRDMNDRCAVDMYDQLLQGAVRDGRSVNDTDDEDDVEGYVKPEYDKAQAAQRDAAAAVAEAAMKQERMQRLKQLRAQANHNQQTPLERMATEVEVWTGRSAIASNVPALVKSKTHRRAGGPSDDDGLISSQVDDDGGSQYRIITTPSYLKGKLRDYQVEGVNWMLDLHRRCVNGILADEMGLGKTFQTISVVAYVKYTLGLAGPHLVVVPKSVLGNWYREFKRWCPTISVLKFHAPGAVRPALVDSHLKKRPIRFDVVLTTYDMVLRELNAFKKVNWNYLIVDEAHKLKNADSSSHTALAAMSTRHRLLITGTPLQNNMKELWSLLSFLAPDLFDDSDVFTKGFDARGADATEVKHLHAVVSSTMLRRLKADVNTSIPPKREIYVSCGVAAKQREWYLKVLAREAGQINRATGSREAIMNIIMQLRKATNHPYLFPDADETGGFVTDERLINDSGKMVVLDKLLAKLRADVEGRHKVLIFSQMTRMLDIMEDYLLFRGYDYCRIDGNTGGVDRDMQMAEFNNPSSSKFVFLLSTRAGGLGINLQAANHVVIYDSDWNPQMDLQAQDRAHRIGQTREVRVYRFVSEGTVEERVYQRALKKLYLDALIVQQGRNVAKKNDNASREELLSMVRFGATEMFKSKGAEVTDADIDALLATGESRMAAMQKEVLKEQRQTLANFDYGVEEANMYEFEGVTFAEGQSRSIVVELPHPVPADELTVQLSKHGEIQKLTMHPDMSKALVVFRAITGAVSAVESSGYTCHFSSKNLQQNVVSVDMIDEHWDGAGRGKRERREVETFEEEVEKAAVAKKVPPPKLPKKPAFSRWWLADEERIRELYAIECGNIIKNWRRSLETSKAGGAAKLLDNEDDDAAADNGGDAPETDEAGEALPLTAAQEKEKAQLWEQAFTSWSHRDFRQFLRAITNGGVSRHDYPRIAEAMGGSKTPQEVEAYARAFWERGPSRIPNFESYEAKIQKVTKRREHARAEAEHCLNKARTCEGDPRFAMALPMKPLNSIHPDFDRRLYLDALQPDGSFKTAHLRAATAQHPVHLFDAYVASRPNEFFERRAMRLRAAVINEGMKAATSRTRGGGEGQGDAMGAA